MESKKDYENTDANEKYSSLIIAVAAAPALGAGPFMAANSGNHGNSGSHGSSGLHGKRSREIHQTG